MEIEEVTTKLSEIQLALSRRNMEEAISDTHTLIDRLDEGIEGVDVDVDKIKEEMTHLADRVEANKDNVKTLQEIMDLDNDVRDKQEISKIMHDFDTLHQELMKFDSRTDDVKECVDAFIAHTNS